MNTYLKYMSDIRDLLSDRDRWTQLAFARNAYGDEVMSDSPTAVCFCLLGAVNKIVPKDDQTQVLERLMEDSLLHNKESFITFNDKQYFDEEGRVIQGMHDKHHGEVMAFLDYTIERAQTV